MSKLCQKIQEQGVTYLSDAELVAAVGQFPAHAAERLLQESGGLVQLRHYSIEQLRNHLNIGPARAAAIKAAFDLAPRLVVADKPIQIDSPEKAAELFVAKIGGQEQEHLMVMSLDTKNHVLAMDTIYIGNVNTSIVRIAEVFRSPIRRNATAIIIAHNHPSGDVSASPEDVQCTHTLIEAGQILSIEVLDHIVVGHGRWVSLKERGLAFDNF